MVCYFVLLFFVASLFLSPTLCGSVEYYVTPTSPPNTDCPQPCYTLDQYALDTTLLSNKENVSLLFLEGLHTLNHTLRISGTKKLSLTPAHSRSAVSIKCNGRLSIRFEDVTHVHISNLTLHGTLAQSITWLLYDNLKNHTTLFQHLIVEGFNMELPESSTLYYCTLNNTAVNICSGNMPNFRSKLLLYKSKTVDSIIMGLNFGFCTNLELKIVGCTIDRYHDKELADYLGTVVLSIGPATNLHVEIADTWVDGELVITGEQDDNNISLYIQRSEIRNSNFNYNTISVELGYETRNNNIQVQITDSKISNANVHSLILGVDLTFVNIIEILVANTSISDHQRKGAIKVQTNLNSKEDNVEERPLESKTRMRINLEKCSFINNKVGVIVEVESSLLRFEMLITDSTFHGNGNAINIGRKSQASQTTMTSRLIFVSLRNVTLENNSPLLLKSGVMYLYNVDMLNIQDCRFINN